MTDTEEGAGVSLLSVEGLTVSFVQYDRGIRRRVIPALNGVDLSVEPGELLTVVGASGSGKSLLAHAVLGLLPGNATCQGTIRYDGEELTGEVLRRVRGSEIRLIPQSVNYLDPSLRVGEQLRLGIPDRSKPAVYELLESFGLDADVYRRFPHELSGGMARRVLLSTCFGDSVRLVIADEPTPGIHPDALAEILTEFRKLRDAGISVMLITHDMVSGMGIADRVAVFHNGRITCTFTPAQLLDPNSDIDPYARRLWAAQPANDFWEARA